MINLAVASDFQLLLLDASGKPKVRAIQRLARDRVIGEEQLAKIQFLRPTALVQISADAANIPQVLVTRFEYWKDDQRIRVDYLIKPVSGRVSVSPESDFDIGPFLRLGKIKGTWRVQILMAYFPLAVFEKAADKMPILNALRYTTVLNAGIQWEVLGGSPIEGLDRTGQYRDPDDAQAVLNSSQNYGLDEV